MLQLGKLEAGSRHHLHVGISPMRHLMKAPSTTAKGCSVTLTPTRRHLDANGPGVRIVLVLSGCLLRCACCHNPDTWHLKDGTYVSIEQVINRLADFAPALRSMGGGLTISGGEPMVQLAFTRRILSAAKDMGLHTAIETSGLPWRSSGREDSCQRSVSCSSGLA